jgi:hypothetical protein
VRIRDTVGPFEQEAGVVECIVAPIRVQYDHVLATAPEIRPNEIANLNLASKRKFY